MGRTRGKKKRDKSAQRQKSVLPERQRAENRTAETLQYGDNTDLKRWRWKERERERG